ncbi:hypothetical protein ACIBG6_06570 [Streptomyces sp. NPDC050842]|uniref:hypothetical protein n=1 Tax=Streptomyces sp. NPDC050842 TaxID=3365636 RepID=UPI003793C3EC
MTTASEPADRLAAFGNHLVDVHIWLREELARLREDVDSFLSGGADRPRNPRAHCLAFCGLIALVDSHFTYEENKLVTALNELGAPLPDDFTLSDLTGR